MNRIAAVVAGLSLAFVGTSASFADTINVPGDYALIQDAINASVNGDVINIAAGTYYESDLNPDGKVITIQGTLNEDGTLATTIDAQQNARVVTINSGEGSGTVIRDLVITGGSTSGFGGGITIRNGSSPIISNCTISDNSADRSGGGIMCHNSSNPTITGCTISGNSANGDGTDARGGGIYCFNSEPTITDCTISDNQANYAGGGIHCWDSNPIISSCTISGNWAVYGGGIMCHFANPAISDCTISGNEANDSGGGVHGEINSNPTIIGSVICENVPDQTFGSYSSSDTCIEQVCDMCSEDADSDDDGVPDNQDQCPGHDDYADADGDGTADGCDAFPNDPNEWADTDGDGVGDSADPIWTLSSGDSIQEAIDNAYDGIVIDLAAGTYYEYSLNPDGKAITIQGTLNGDGTLATTIDAQQNARVFTFNSGEGTGTVVRDLVITGGSTTGTGGGISIRNSSNPSIIGCTISGNQANEEGGGIFCTNSNPTINDCTISDNEANYDGGGIFFNNSNPTLTDCTISNNTANFHGGGIACEYSDPTITDCTISDNEANYDGGGIYCWAGNPTISSCTISGNEAGNGGGIYSVYTSSPTISGSIICENTPNQINGSHTDFESCIRQNCESCYEDSDDDGVIDHLDQCPGYDDNTDADSDGMPDDCDNCPNDPFKTEPGDCGCGELETDTDSDGTPDCIDGCPEDSLKTEPEMCGCGSAETNVNGDVDCDGDYDIDDIYAGMDNFGITTGTPGDVNADGTVDTSDLDELRSSLDLCASDTDLDGDTDIEDLLNVVAGWGTTCP